MQTADSFPQGLRTNSALRVALVACVAAFLIYSCLGLISHYALRTSAFDLSVFDYALWTTASGGPLGYVPLFRHSLFAQHWMPTLLLLTPLSYVWSSPAYLIVLQSLFFSVAGVLFFGFAERHVSRGMALSLLAAFLFSRRSHSAVTSYFYIESAEPMLIFGALLAWSHGRAAIYWILLVLAMGCKEDVALYFVAFGGLLVITRSHSRTGGFTIAAASAWLVFSLFVAIPHWRHVYGLGSASPFLEGRYGVSGDGLPVWVLAGRLFSFGALARVVTVAGATGFLCFLSPSWMAVALPGIGLNLVALPGTGQASLNGHYLWPILPWLFVAAVFGAHRLRAAASLWWPAAVLLLALIDMPLPRTIAAAPWRGLREAAMVRSQLRTLSLSGTIVAQPNLIPHLPTRQVDVHGFGVYSAGQPPGDYVLFTTVGDLWPLDARAVAREVSTLQNDARYQQISGGPLFAFRRR
jgi:uncharacterized membrane protein